MQEQDAMDARSLLRRYFHGHRAREEAVAAHHAAAERSGLHHMPDFDTSLSRQLSQLNLTADEDVPEELTLVRFSVPAVLVSHLHAQSLHNLSPVILHLAHTCTNYMVWYVLLIYMR